MGFLCVMVESVCSIKNLLCDLVPFEREEREKAAFSYQCSEKREMWFSHAHPLASCNTAHFH